MTFSGSPRLLSSSSVGTGPGRGYCRSPGPGPPCPTTETNHESPDARTTVCAHVSASAVVCPLGRPARFSISETLANNTV